MWGVRSWDAGSWGSLRLVGGPVRSCGSEDVAPAVRGAGGFDWIIPRKDRPALAWGAILLMDICRAKPKGCIHTPQAVKTWGRRGMPVPLQVVKTWGRRGMPVPLQVAKTWGSRGMPVPLQVAKTWGRRGIAIPPQMAKTAERAVSSFRPKWKKWRKGRCPHTAPNGENEGKGVFLTPPYSKNGHIGRKYRTTLFEKRPYWEEMPHHLI